MLIGPQPSEPRIQVDSGLKDASWSDHGLTSGAMRGCATPRVPFPDPPGNRCCGLTADHQSTFVHNISRQSRLRWTSEGHVWDTSP